MYTDDNTYDTVVAIIESLNSFARYNTDKPFYNFRSDNQNKNFEVLYFEIIDMLESFNQVSIPIVEETFKNIVDETFKIHPNTQKIGVLAFRL